MMFYQSPSPPISGNLLPGSESVPAYRPVGKAMAMRLLILKRSSMGDVMPALAVRLK
jgi:hypothetical protein